jgi:photosystem II stability/assembly factor-like uncharacterized protein
MKNLRLIAFIAVIGLLLLGGCREEKPVVLADPPKPLAAAVTPTPTLAPTNTPFPKESQQYIRHYADGQAVMIFDIRIRTLTNGWAIGRAGYDDHDHVLITANAGDTWQDVSPPQKVGDDLLRADGFFLDADTAFVIYTSADQFILLGEFVVWRTIDRGQSWQVSSVLELTGLEEYFVPERITFADSQTGWLSASVGAGMSHNFTNLYQTLDGGATWTRVLDPLNGEGLQSCEKTGLVFADQNNGWAGLNCHGLYPGVTFAATTDGGSYWDFVDLPEPFNAPDLFTDEDVGHCYSHSLHLFGTQHGIVAITCEYLDQSKPTENFLYITENGGGNWISLPVPAGAWHFYSFYQGYLVHEKIWHTNNQAASVGAIAAMPFRGEFNFINSQMGWAVSHDGGETNLYRTIDSGKTWEKIMPVIVP